MDNESIHATPAVKELIERRRYKVTNFPPYSPFVNPIE